MCGIAGIVLGDHERAGSIDARNLEIRLAELASRLVHRGPDASGISVHGRFGLAHRRLSILDLSSAGAQPMFTPDRRFVIAFNGEIYNFSRLREELEASGEHFAGHSDTEVVLRLLSREGEAALARLDGMFALAFADTASGEILLARDRMGQKPLYVALLPGGGHAFASEIRALLAVPGVDRRLDPQSLSHALSFSFLPNPFTLRRGITQLRPGTAMRIAPNRPSRTITFAPRPGPGHPPQGGDLGHLEAELESRLSSAVREHLVADVPVGVLLSGGVDSSVVAALAARHTGTLDTFCVTQRDPKFDERAPARAVAEAIGSRHHEIELPLGGLSEEDLDAVIDHHGDPFGDYSSLNVLQLSRQMRRHVKVALSGDGGDEIFAGYARFRQLRWLGWLGSLPRPALRVLSAVAETAAGERGRQIQRAVAVARLPAARRVVAFTTCFWPEEQASILKPEWRTETAGEDLDRLLVERGADCDPDPVASAHWFEQQLILPDDMLTKVDRMSMAASLEIRAPLLANSVVDFSWGLPFDAKLKNGAGKYLLRRLARRLVPPWVIDRPKQGFTLDLIAHGGSVLSEATRFALESRESPLLHVFRDEARAALAHEFFGDGKPRGPEDSAYRRARRQWLIALLARVLAREPAF